MILLLIIYAQFESILKSWDGSLVEIFDYIVLHKTVRIAIEKTIQAD